VFWDENGSEKSWNSRSGRKNQLVDRKRVSVGKVEGLYNGKEKETFKDGKQSV